MQSRHESMYDRVSDPVRPQELVEAVERQLSGKAKPPGEGLAVPKTASTDPALVFDQSTLERHLGNDLDLCKEVLVVFLEDALGQIKRLEQACGQGDAKTVLRQAHTLKGAAANVAAVELSATAGAIEMAAHDGELARAASLVRTLSPQFDSFQGLVRELVLVE